jgi:hypothetical protein
MRFLCLLTLSAMAVGCGGSKTYDGPDRVAISGKVTFDEEPVDAGMISFIPESREKHRPASAVITKGEYTIPEAQGPNEGAYKVEIRWSRPTGEQILDTQDTGEMIDVTKEVIPAKFNTQSELSEEITKQTNTFNYDLKSE